jgi:hypothetical protein
MHTDSGSFVRETYKACIMSGLTIVWVCEMACDLQFEDAKEVFRIRNS